MNKLCVDIGFGSVKVAFGDEVQVSKLYKFTSAIANVAVSEFVHDDRVIPFEGKNYYVGDDALALQSSSIIDVNKYELLEYYAPVFLFKIIRDLQMIPDRIVLGLSIAQITNSAHFKKRVEDFLKNHNINIPIDLLPQGMISKLVIEKHGISFPDKEGDFPRYNNYVGCDIGFNTLDIFQVINGKTSSNLARGIPERGLQVIVSRLIAQINQDHSTKLTLNEGKEVLATGIYRKRNNRFDYSEFIRELKKDYVKELMVIIENEFGAILDKMEALIIFGGGAYSLQDVSDEFVLVPKSHAEYYNVVSYYYFNGSK